MIFIMYILSLANITVYKYTNHSIYIIYVSDTIFYNLLHYHHIKIKSHNLLIFSLQKIKYFWTFFKIVPCLRKRCQNWKEDINLFLLGREMLLLSLMLTYLIIFCISFVTDLSSSVWIKIMSIKMSFGVKKHPSPFFISVLVRPLHVSSSVSLICKAP